MDKRKLYAMTLSWGLIFCFLIGLLHSDVSIEGNNQFDFWIGEWNLTWGEDGHGTNIIKKIMDEHVILENFDGGESSPLRGMSVSVYNRDTGQWHQTWVDNQGGYLDFVGEYKNNKMVLSREAEKDGEKFLQRMVWYNIGENELDWNWERSDDGGATWEILWKIHYRRNK